MVVDRAKGKRAVRTALLAASDSSTTALQSMGSGVLVLLPTHIYAPKINNYREAAQRGQKVTSYLYVCGALVYARVTVYFDARILIFVATAKSPRIIFAAPNNEATKYPRIFRRFVIWSSMHNCCSVII